MSDDKPRGHVRRLWSKHGGGYYALIVVGTFLYLEAVDLWSGVSTAGSVQGFMISELVTFGIESFLNALRASFWPFHWFAEYGWTPLYAFGVGYLIWTLALAAALDAREKALKRDLGL